MAENASHHTKETTAKCKLSAELLSIGYASGQAKTIVSDRLSFEFKQGEFVAIVGPNGVGKSTLLRTLARLQPGLGGRISFKGKPIEDFPSKHWARLVSVVLTEPIASKNLEVSQLVSLGRHPYTNWLGALSEKDVSIIRAAVNRVGLEFLRDKKCHTLSDGQFQKVLVARALAQDTEVILLDEPTTHLDLYHRAQILKLLQGFAHQDNKLVVFTSHEIELAIQLCDKILILEPDELKLGTPGELIENGHFDALFPKDTIAFDAASGTFKVQKSTSWK